MTDAIHTRQAQYVISSIQKKKEEKPQDHEQTHFSLIPVNKSLAENWWSLSVC